MNHVAVFFFTAALSVALVGVVLRSVRASLICVWASAFFAGAAFLALGAEFLAIVQWIVSSVCTLGFLFFELMFGNENAWSSKTKRYDAVAAALIALIFAATLVLTMQKQGTGVLDHVSMLDLGRAMLRRYFLLIQVLAVVLLVSVVGIGVIARAERPYHG